jgi:hypothetical protein
VADRDGLHDADVAERRRGEHGDERQSDCDGNNTRHDTPR